MGKSILKKILAVVLTVAVVIGVIEIPPMVKADTYPDTVNFSGTNKVGATLSFTFTLNDTDLYYNAQAQKPSVGVSAVRDSDGEPVCNYPDITEGDRDISLVYEEAINASDSTKPFYTVTLSPGSSGEYDFPSQTLRFQIKKAVPSRIQSYTLDQSLVAWDGQAHVPTFSSVVVGSLSGDISVPASDYTVEALDGWNFISADKHDCEIKLKTDNFETAATKAVTDYYVAYDLSDPDIVKAYLDSTEENTASATSFTVAEGYTAASLKNNYKLYNAVCAVDIPMTGWTARYKKDGVGVNSLGGTLAAGSDYSVTHTLGDSAVLRGGYYYFGEKTATVHVSSKMFDNLTINVVGDSTDEAIVLDSAQFSYQTLYPTVTFTSGAQAKPYSMTVFDGTTLLSQGVDYTVEYNPDNTISIGVVRVTVTGKGRYSDAGSVSFRYYINSPLSITLGSPSVEYGNNGTSSEIPSYTVTDNAGTSESVLTSDLYTLKYGYVDSNGVETDVDLSDANMRTIGKKYVYVEGKLVYTGQNSSKAYFDVVPAKLTYSDSSATALNNRFTMTLNPGNSTYTGADVAQTVTVNDSKLGGNLDPVTDYAVRYYKKTGSTYEAVTECVDSGTYQVRAYGTGQKYDSSTYAAKEFRIGAINVGDASLDKNVVYYEGSSTKAPSVKYTNGGRTTVLYNGETGTCAPGITVIFDQDRTKTAPGNSIGRHYISLAGDGVNFEGSFSHDYEVRKAILKDLLSTTNVSVEWIGTDEYMSLPDYSRLVFKEADGRVMSSDKYTIEPSDDNNLPGTGKLLVTPVGDYADFYEAGEIEYTIKKRGTANLAVDLGDQDMTWNAGESKYEYTYPNLRIFDTVSGNEIEIPADKFDVTYSANKKAGNSATITITPKAAAYYTGTINKTFTCGIDISAPKGQVELKFAGNANKDTGLVYTGSDVEPQTITVRVSGIGPLNSSDYTVSYKNLTSGLDDDKKTAGTVEITIAANSDSTVYYGTLTETYNINAITLDNSNTKIEWNSGTTHDEPYTGEAIEPDALKVMVDMDRNGSYETELPRGDYDLAYLNNINQTEDSSFDAYVYLVTKEGSNYKFPEFRSSAFQAILNSNVVFKPFRITKVSMSEVTVVLSDYEYDYDGNSHVPDVTVTYNEKELRKGTDYNVRRCLDDVNSTAYAISQGMSGTYIEVTGAGNFKDTVSPNYVIKQLDLGNSSANVRAVLRDNNRRLIYDGDPVVSGDMVLYDIKYGDTLLVEGKDYYFKDAELAALNYNPGQVNLYVYGKNNCTNYAVISIDIYREINNTDFAVKDPSNAANKIKPNDTVSETVLKSFYDSDTLNDLVDLYANDGSTRPINTLYYTATVDGCDIGTHVMTIKGVEDQHYTGSISFTFTVTGDISTDGAYIEPISDKEWTGSAVEPPVVYVRLPGGGRLDTRYYTVAFEDNIDPGYAKVTVTASGIYSGTLTDNFKIVYPANKLKVDWTDAANVNTDNIPFYVYDGTEKQPGFDLFYDFRGVKPDGPVHGGYTVSYANNKNAGTGTVTITADTSDPDCFIKGSVTKPIVIDPKLIYAGMLNHTANYVDEISSDFYDYIPTGIFPVPTLSDILGTGSTYSLVQGSDYKITYGANNTIADGGTVTITGMGNYTGTLTQNIRIRQKDISDTGAIEVTATNASYTGLPAEPGSISVKYTDIFGKSHTLGHNPASGMDYYISAYYTMQNVVTGTVGSVAADGTVTEAVAPTEKGTYIVEIKGLGNYAGTNKTATYTITARSLTAVSVSVQNSAEYTGNPIVPEISIVDGATNLVENIDFTIEYSNKLRYDDSVVAGDHTNAGVVTLTITGIGNYTETVVKTMTITPRDIRADQATAADYGYKYAVNKSITYANGTENTAGRHTMGFVAGGTAVPDVILHDTTRNADLTCKNDGAAYPDYRLTFASQYETLASEEDAPSWAGRIVMTVEGLGNYTGSVPYVYYIGEDISGATASLTTGVYTAEYDGLYRDLKDSYVLVDSSRFRINDDQRKITVYKGDVLDDNGELILDNVIDITKIVDADKYYIVVDGVPEKGTYAATPSMTCTYTVTPKSIFNCTIDNFPETVYYTGDYITVKGITVTDTTLPVSRERGAATIKATLREGIDYEIDNTKKYKDVGKATITVKGIGNYRGTATAYYTIEQNSISGGDKDDGSTSGTGLTSDGVTITAEDIRFTYTGDGYMKYTGAAVVPYVTIIYGSRNLVAGKEYIVTAVNNVNAGIGTLTISGVGGFSGYLTKKFTIKADMAGAKVAAIPDQVYTGSEVTPSLTVNCGGNTLGKGSDYTVTYKDNISVGKAKATLEAADNSYYYGSKDVEFNISNSASGMIVTGYASTYTYTGYAITPALSVTMDGTVLTAGTDYVVSYSNNINVGTAKAVVTGKGQYSGTKTIEYRIVAKNLSNCAADLSGGDSYEYTGSTYTPAVTLTDLVSNKTLVKGTDYNVTYSNNTDPGTATITMTALSDNYTGTKVVTFNIGSAAVKGLKAASVTWKTIKLKWTKQPYASGYQICDKNNKVIGTSKSNSYKVRGLTSYTTYNYKVRSYVKNDDGTVSYGAFSSVLSEKTKLKTPKLTVKAIGGGKVLLTWTKSRLATGYEIYYSTEKNGVYTKLKTVSVSSKLSVTDAGLAAGEKYYYTVRAYRNVNGAKEYSNYNTIKSVSVR